MYGRLCNYFTCQKFYVGAFSASLSHFRLFLLKKAMKLSTVTGTTAFTFMSFILPVHSLKDLILEDFGSDDFPHHKWIAVNDPVMGGQSTGSFTVEGGLGVFEGEVKDVPFLKAPGFIAVRNTSGGSFPDLRTCEGLSLNIKSSNEYTGFRVSFGTKVVPGNFPYAMGFKTHFDPPPAGTFGEVVLPFESFTDNWDAKTGDPIVTCQDDAEYCPDDETLLNIQRIEIMAEGVLGEIQLEIQSIKAVGCADDAKEMDNSAHRPSVPLVETTTSIIASTSAVAGAVYDKPATTYVGLFFVFILVGAVLAIFVRRRRQRAGFTQMSEVQIIV